MVRQQTSVLILSGVLFFTTTQLAFALSNDQKLLSKCEAVYMYSAHLAQMQNNNGLATNLLFRAARSTTALFMISEVNGVIKGSVIDQFKRIGRISKGSLDSGETEVMKELSECDLRALPIAIDVERTRKKLWGYTFQELQNQALQKLKQTIGL
tara:strand:- start:250 stop:711 length:462 start_codon:yes stop_codon:yes gene_type:complete